jgi:hypothetical protein
MTAAMPRSSSSRPGFLFNGSLLNQRSEPAAPGLFDSVCNKNKTTEVSGMKISRKVVLSVLLVALLAIPLVARADNMIEPITASINHAINITWNGQSFTPKDTDGTPLDPIVYNGHTYLPLAAIAKQAGLQTNWNASTSTVAITSGAANAQPGQNNETATTDFSALKCYYNSNVFYNPASVSDGAVITMAGEQYASGVQLPTTSLFCFSATKCSWNLNSQYSTLTATLGLDDRDDGFDTTVKVIGDGNVIKTFQLSAGSLPQNISIPVEGVNQLTFNISVPVANGVSATVDLANAALMQ